MLCAELNLASKPKVNDIFLVYKREAYVLRTDSLQTEGAHCYSKKYR